MSIIKKMRKQKVVWWAKNPEPDRYGKYSFEPPVEIDCRWDDVAEEYRDPQGQVALSSSVVYPDRVLKTGDMLREGVMDSNEPADPTDVGAVFEIKRFDKTPNLRATETLYTAYL